MSIYLKIKSFRLTINVTNIFKYKFVIIMILSKKLS